MENFDEVLRQNRLRLQERRMKIKKQQRREQIKEWILFLFITAFITVMLFMTLNNINEDSMNRCMEKGYSRLVCEKNV